MEPNTQRHKRIVSKGAYAKAQGKKAAFSFLGMGFLVSTVSTGLLVLLFLNDYMTPALSANAAMSPDPLPGQILLAAIGCLGSLYLAIRALNKTARIDPGVPLTRATHAHLPARESLVRASQEPAPVPEGMLLRAAVINSQMAAGEQLLRAVSQ